MNHTEYCTLCATVALVGVAKLNWAFPTSSANVNIFENAFYMKSGSMLFKSLDKKQILIMNDNLKASSFR